MVKAFWNKRPSNPLIRSDCFAFFFRVDINRPEHPQLSPSLQKYPFSYRRLLDITDRRVTQIVIRFDSLSNLIYFFIARKKKGMYAFKFKPYGPAQA